MVEKALVIQPNDYKDWWLCSRGKRHYTAGRYEQARKVFTQAFNENNWGIHLVRAYTLP